MLAQTTFFVVLLATIALGALSTNLISTGVAHEQQIAKYQELATDDAVEGFTSLMQSYVAAHGSNGPWPSKIPNSRFTPLCTPSTAATSCPYSYIVSATITGFSIATPFARSGQNASDDVAINLQTFLINEQRISARITATMTDASGQVVGSNTRYVTLRVFDSAPFAEISGQHGVQSTNGRNGAVEADNGGVGDKAGGFKNVSSPDLADPNAYRNTEIKATMNCRTVDAIFGPDSDSPSHNQGRGNRGLPWGIGANGGFELPCTSVIATPSPGTFKDENWQNGNAPTNGSD